MTTQSSKSTRLFTACCLCFAVFIVARPSAAADPVQEKAEEKPGEAAAGEAKPESPVLEKPDATAASQAGDTVEAAPVGGIERMPGSAFWPPPYLRGLFGGSLWLNPVHGLQWPYYRRTGIGVSGDVWVDTSYARLNRGEANAPKERPFIQQARMVLRVTPTYTQGNWFVQAQAELVANKDQTLKQPDVADTDDLWIRIGSWNKWDIQVGRFQAWEIYHLGMALDLNTFERKGAYDLSPNTPPDIYGVTYAWGRPSGVGNVGAHLYFTDYLRVELLGQLGSENGHNSLGGRPVAILDLGWLKFKVGGEYKKTTQVNPTLPASSEQRGGGAGLSLIFNPWVEFGFNVARGLVDEIDDRGNINPPGSYTITSYGGFANARLGLEDLLVGVGYDSTYKINLHYDVATSRYGEFTHTQMFAAVQYIIRKQLFVKLVGAYAKGDERPTLANGDYINTTYSARLRLMYLF